MAANEKREFLNIGRSQSQGAIFLCQLVAAVALLLSVGGCGSAGAGNPNGTSGSAAISTHSVGLTWVASSSVVSGYNIYRGSQTGGPYQLLSSSGTNAYTDPNVVSGQTLFYVVTAVDVSGSESVFSNEAVAVIP